MDANSGRRIASSRQSFNPRARDGRETGLCNMYTRHSRFNPRARDGRELCHVAQAPFRFVSIHAPVMDANVKASIWQWIVQVSIHAPVMDAKMRCIVL